MNSWSRNRKRIILGIVIAIIFFLIALPAYFIFYRAPNCTDGKMNGDETGVDCGGSCQLLCKTESLPLLLKGDARVLFPSSETYQIVALAENANNDAEVYRAGYTIKVYDASSTLPLNIINGETFIPKGSVFAIFEGPFRLNAAGAIPRRATLEWKNDTIVWKKNTTQIPELTVVNKNLSRLDEAPRLVAVIANRNLQNVSNIDLTAAISDAQGNIFAASRTYIDSLRAGEEREVVFTWPKPFGREPVKTEIIVRIFPDRSFIK